MSRGIFVTGTDTGVGKTFIAAGILRYLRYRDIDAVPVKPVQTGGIKEGDELKAPDLEFCLNIAGLTPEPEEKSLMAPYIYEPACGPHLAGKMAGSLPRIRVIKKNIEILLESRQAVVVEGAGGIMVPLNESEMTLELMQTLGFPVVLVSRPGLGTINHTLLSIQALRRSGLDILGMAFTHAEEPAPEDKFILDDNPETVARFGDVRVLGNVRHFADINRDTWNEFEADMPGLNSIYEVMQGED